MAGARRAVRWMSCWIRITRDQVLCMSVQLIKRTGPHSPDGCKVGYVLVKRGVSYPPYCSATYVTFKGFVCTSKSADDEQSYSCVLNKEEHSI